MTIARRKLRLFAVAAALAFAAASELRAAELAHWPQWRGPNFDGISDDARVPTTWGADVNLKWQLDLPGLGHSSPIVWGDRVFLTSATETGTERYVFCIDRTTGKLLWRQTAVKDLPAEPTHAWNTHASSTCATDGERVYAFFGTPGLFCYDLDGKPLWKREFGPLVASTDWGGGAASPRLFDKFVYVNGDHGSYRGQKDETGKEYGSSWLWALDKVSGEIVWKTERNQGMGWCTPVVWTNAERQELVLNGQIGVWSYDPWTGRELWNVVGRADDEGFGEVTPVWGHGLLYVFTGKPGPAWAIRPGGVGDVSQSHVVWRIKRKERDVGSPVLVGDHLFTLSRTGIATCVHAKTGEELWKERLGGQPSASLVALPGRVLFVSDDGTTSVVEPAAEFKLLAVNKLGDGDVFRASPAVADGQLLIRSDRRLYCIETAAKN
jgi:outer membrane protein assembly factor BamB